MIESLRIRLDEEVSQIALDQTLQEHRHGDILGGVDNDIVEMASQVAEQRGHISGLRGVSAHLDLELKGVGARLPHFVGKIELPIDRRLELDASGSEGHRRGLRGEMDAQDALPGDFSQDLAEPAGEHVLVDALREGVARPRCVCLHWWCALS